MAEKLVDWRKGGEVVEELGMEMPERRRPDQKEKWIFLIWTERWREWERWFWIWSRAWSDCA